MGEPSQLQNRRECRCFIPALTVYGRNAGKRALAHDLAVERAEGSVRDVLARVAPADVMVVDDGPWRLWRKRRVRLVILRGPLPGWSDDSDLASASDELAQADRQRLSATALYASLVHNAHRIALKGCE